MNNDFEIQADKLIKYCGTQSHVVVTEDTKEIQAFAFADCVNLESVSLPSGVLVQAGAFRGCINLKLLDFPQGSLSVSHYSTLRFEIPADLGRPENLACIAHSLFGGVCEEEPGELEGPGDDFILNEVRLMEKVKEQQQQQQQQNMTFGKYLSKNNK